MKLGYRYWWWLTDSDLNVFIIFHLSTFFFIFFFLSLSIPIVIFVTQEVRILLLICHSPFLLFWHSFLFLTLNKFFSSSLSFYCPWFIFLYPPSPPHFFSQLLSYSTVFLAINYFFIFPYSQIQEIISLFPNYFFFTLSFSPLLSHYLFIPKLFLLLHHSFLLLLYHLLSHYLFIPRIFLLLCLSLFPLFSHYLFMPKLFLLFLFHSLLFSFLYFLTISLFPNYFFFFITLSFSSIFLCFLIISLFKEYFFFFTLSSLLSHYLFIPKIFLLLLSLILMFNFCF